MTKLFTIASIVAAALGTAANPAAAQEVTVKVGYADLDLGSAAGQATLDNRIKVAARYVCGGKPEMRDLGATQRFGSCFRGAVEGSRQQLATAGQGGAITLAAR